MVQELKSYAVTDALSKGRKFAEAGHLYRSDFERDRDRVIHSVAFRRLEGKTQVFTPGVNDSYRNRLTHSIEVAQIGRTIARTLGLNETLAEGVCLAHDLGHSPFGHAGESVLNGIMKEFGGFEHNRQSLRIVDFLEHPYPEFMGLNLMYETRLAIARHESTYDSPKTGVFSESNCSLEGQIAGVADRIAYNCHDLEDGLLAGIIKVDQLMQVGIFNQAREKINADRIEDSLIRNTRTAKTIIDILVSDCIETSREKIKKSGVETVEDVLGLGESLIAISDSNNEKLKELEKFLLNKFYLHEKISQTAEKVRIWLGGLFVMIYEEPGIMPRYFQNLIEKEGAERIVCDYIAGMTDRYCLKMLEKIN
ncbi:MAG TPA: deoxyguanosinetriphosphate triphosphohydrolase [Sedimentisphaerales bacterium]|nr:deoxyguanosinetriphosphate triphosphohydrolase [Sedimentisphaerales bacterium]